MTSNTDSPPAAAHLSAGGPDWTILANHFPGVVFQARNDQTYSMLYVNDVWQQLTGCTKTDVLAGRVNLMQIVHPEDAAKLRSTVDQALQARQGFDLTYRVQRSNGQWRWVRQSGAGVFHGDELTYIEGFLTDVTDH